MDQSAPIPGKTTTPKTTTQLKHMLIDVDFAAKPKIKAMRAKFGQLARLWLIDVLCDLSRATNAEIERWAAIAIAQDLGITNGDELIDYCLERGILVEPRSGVISNDRVLTDQQKLATTQQKWRDRQAVSRGCHEGVTRDIPETRERLNTEVLNTEDLKEEVRPFRDVSDPVERWRLYLRKKFNKDLDEIQRETLLMNWAARPAQELIDGINQSIEKGYRKIVYEPPDERPQRGSAKGKHVQTMEDISKM
jgi:hypothetical protein